MKKLVLGIMSLGLIAFTSCEKKEAVAVSDAGEVATAGNEATTYTVDTVESKVDWRGFKFYESENREAGHYGFIKLNEGSIQMENNHIVAGNFVIDVASLESMDMNDNPDKKADLDGHLKDTDFLDVEKYPTSTFEITGVKEIEGDFNTEISGNLTMRETPKQITFKANTGINDGVLEIKSEEFSINRKDFGIVYEGGGEAVIKDNVSLQIYVKALPAGEDTEAANTTEEEDLGH